MADGNMKPTIPETFDGKKVLITGATGFVGKVLVEKLLRSCPGISEIIILIRGKSEDERREKLNKFVRHKVFDRINEECPNVMRKIRPIKGEIAWKAMGIEPNILETLCQEVSFVFHCAANVRFDCDPAWTLDVNVKGVKQLLKLCKQMTKLEAVVHVSTAFSFCNQPIIGEEVYSERVKPSSVLNALKWMRHGELKEFAKYLTEGRPSLYHASKAIAELLIEERRENLPIIIVRPAIVTAAMNEPFPGWIDNYNGPSGFIALSSKGILKTLLVKENVNADWVPVDVVANTLIAAAHFMAVNGKFSTSSAIEASKVPIINCVCPFGNQIKWSSVVDITVPLLFEYPSSTVCVMPGGVVTSSEVVHTMCKYLFHYLPAYLLDTTCLAVLKNSGLVTMYTKIHSVLNHLQLYTTHQFLFTSKNMQHLNREMSSTDRNAFPIDLFCLNWPLYLRNYVLGVRRYFLKEDDDTLPAAKKRVKILKVLHYSSIVLISGGTFYFVVKRWPPRQTFLGIKNVTTRVLMFCGKFLPKFEFVD